MRKIIALSFFIVFTLIGCGPSVEEIREQERARLLAEQEQERARLLAEQEQERRRVAELEEMRRLDEQRAREERAQQVLDNWTERVNSYTTMKNDEQTSELFPDTELYITADQQSLIFNETSYALLGLVAFPVLDYLGIPEYIVEKISQTAPIDGIQQDQFENIRVEWRVSRESGRYSGTGKISLYVGQRILSNSENRGNSKNK